MKQDGHLLHLTRTKIVKRRSRCIEEEGGKREGRGSDVRVCVCEEGGVKKTLWVDKQQHIDPQSLTDHQRETDNGDVEKAKLKPDSIIQL